MLRQLHIYIGITLLFQVVHLNANDLKSIIDFADSLWMSKDFPKALQEYRRAYYFAGPEYKSPLSEKIASCYMKAENYKMARIFYELVMGEVVCNEDPAKDWAYMIDQCSGRENRMHAILHSIDSLQVSLAKAMLVNSAKLEELQAKDEIILANRYYNDAL